jgi:hypothetical protein
MEEYTYYLDGEYDPLCYDYDEIMMLVENGTIGKDRVLIADHPEHGKIELKVADLL